MKSDNNLCVEVACFVKNEKLPTHEDFTNKPKHEGDEPEYLNELMWAHYADSHRRSKEFIEELPIEFYQIKLDTKEFGKLEAEKISNPAG